MLLNIKVEYYWIPLVTARSKKKRMGTENMMLVTQADNTNHLALLSGIKYKVSRYQKSFLREVGISTHSSC